MAREPIVVNMRHPSPGPHQRVGTQLIALGGRDEDVSLIKINTGPVPYIVPVAPVGFRSDGDCWSCGFDAMEFPVHCRPARIVGQFDGNAIKTDLRPNHGRSGGSLIDKKTGYLVGVVSAYTGPERSKGEHGEYVPGHHGVYASLSAIQRLLVRAGAMQGDVPQQQYQPQQQYRQQSPFGPGACPIPGSPGFAPGRR